MLPFVSDRNALIIGASRGLGYALADTAVEKHHIRAIGLGRTAPESGLFRRGVENIRCDITETESSGFALEAVVKYRPDFVVWNAGIFDRRPFVDQPFDVIDAMIDTHLRGPIKFLKRAHALQMRQSPLSEDPGKPYHLVVIASTSSYRLRENETLYCALKAAKAAFARQFSRELARDLPGSKTTLVNPGGMKTGFLAAAGQDVSKMMDPFAVAEIVWREALIQQAAFQEIDILREPDGTPRLERGGKAPESPS